MLRNLPFAGWLAARYFAAGWFAARCFAGGRRAVFGRCSGGVGSRFLGGHIAREDGGARLPAHHAGGPASASRNEEQQRQRDEENSSVPVPQPVPSLTETQILQWDAQPPPLASVDPGALYSAARERFADRGVVYARPPDEVDLLAIRG